MKTNRSNLYTRTGAMFALSAITYLLMFVLFTIQALQKVPFNTPELLAVAVTAVTGYWFIAGKQALQMEQEEDDIIPSTLFERMQENERSTDGIGQVLEQRQEMATIDSRTPIGGSVPVSRKIEVTNDAGLEETIEKIVQH